MKATQQQQVLAGSFEQLYTDYYPRILACVRSLARCSQEEAEDITQDAFVNALQAFSSLDPARPAFPWLYAIARNATYHVLRRKQIMQKKGRVEMPENAEKRVGGGGDMEEEAAVREGIQRTLQAISPRYQEALFLWRAGYSYEEIARRQGWTSGSTRAIISRARAAFKLHYEEVPA